MSTPAERLSKSIEAKGPIPFAELMAEALYGTGGYYRQIDSPVGIDGDFVTGSSLSPLFGQSTAELVRRLDVALGTSADVVEVGYGTGLHLRAMQEALGSEPERRILALDRVERPLPDGIERVSRIAELGRRSIRGLIFSYELFDAFPVHRLICRDSGEIGELWVDWDPKEGFRYVEGDLSDPELLEVVGGESLDLAPGQIADVAPDWGPVYADLAGRLESGLMVTCDYGFERRSLYDRRVRLHGTLACYRRQRVHRDALRWVGEQDLTAHVDFTTLVEAGEAAGLETLVLTRQARWLVACGLFESLQEADPSDRLAAMDLLAGDGMGEEIRVLVQSRGVPLEPLLDLDLLSS
jgi:SAM-dependent MidA family methyltransferase